MLINDANQSDRPNNGNDNVIFLYDIILNHGKNIIWHKLEPNSRNLFIPHVPDANIWMVIRFGLKAATLRQPLSAFDSYDVFQVSPITGHNLAPPNYA